MLTWKKLKSLTMQFQNNFSIIAFKFNLKILISFAIDVIVKI